MYLLWLISALFESTFADKRAIDAQFMHRAWEQGRLTDAEYRRKGGYIAKRYVAEKQARDSIVPPAPAAFGFRSRPFN